MDYNQLAQDIISELKGHSRSDAEISGRLGISRQAYIRRRDTNSLTTENITVLSAWLVTRFGGGFYLNESFREEERLMTNQPKDPKPSDSQDNNLRPIQPCIVASGQHAWVPTTGEVMQCYSCPMCQQRIYWSDILKKWVKVNPIVNLHINTNKEKAK